MSWGCKTKNKPDGCGWANWQVELPGMRDWWCDLCERDGAVMTHKVTHSLPPATDSPASVPPEQTPSPADDSAHSGDQCTVGEGP